MTIGWGEMALYCAALLALFATPGPVWVGLVARTLSGGFRAAWPLALGVAVGDVLWPLLAILGLSWAVSLYGGFLAVLRWVATAVFIFMGIALLRGEGGVPGRDGRLTRPGAWAGFATGLAVILGNPKAVLFYMGVLPGFFDLQRLTAGDIAAICAASFAVPLAGNLLTGLSIDRARRYLTAPHVMRRVTRASGVLLIGVGLLLPFV
ncbi:LysE family translocator [Profundibacterium mesophilum]|uniref:Homoserinehomoserine lactone efflux protein n=1 Tax=Profundibacterium mesophilum KAUST100406-0324 TaxID=1037889 RepID=A0A921NQ15_9RHOB|nr:LysE family translocator [Profundibacterium mesophilum]KAF0675952.1 putative homoserinehomoserine lactone efflux protein [Profundibacterium mesophilum KAUST100406-0324]